MNEVDAGREEGASAINKVKFEYKRRRRKVCSKSKEE